MFRRRPVARAAVVGGVAYSASKAGAKSAAAGADQAPEEPEVQQQAAADAAPPEPSASESMDELTKLKGLLDSGVLTQAQFDAQKQKILQSM